MRTFIAVDLDREIKKSLSSLIEKLILKREKIKWVQRQGMHITLKFLGEIEKAQIPEVENILRNISENFKSFSLKIKGTGYFPPEKKNPRVLWVGIEADKTLFVLQEQVETELEKIGFPREKRSFHPHLTLGRVKTFSFIHETIKELKKYQEAFFGEMIVNKITLFQSILKPSGAEYIVLSEYLLK
ncbi:MAG: RNA 2',3'-cyclic phosphodiesterase [Candidatus Aminicenantaceae bacterium]